MCVNYPAFVQSIPDYINWCHYFYIKRFNIKALQKIFQKWSQLKKQASTYIYLHCFLPWFIAVKSKQTYHQIPLWFIEIFIMKQYIPEV